MGKRDYVVLGLVGVVVLLALAVGLCFLPAGIATLRLYMGLMRGGPAYLAEIERVEPPIPGLRIEEFPAVIGAIQVTNNTGQDVYFFDEEGQEIFKITSTESFWKENGQWVCRVH